MTSSPDRTRRLLGALIASACVAPATRAFAAGYPDKAVRLVVPFPPGGITDVISRSLANSFQQSTGQPLIVDNRPGGGGIIATDMVAKAAPDGYTVLMVAIGQAVVNNHIFKKLPYDPKADLIPVSLIAQGPNVLIVNADSPYKTLADLLKAAKADPSRLTFGSYGNGSSPHLAAALLSQRTGAVFTHIPYKGAAPAMTDLLGGQTSFMFDSLITSLQHLKSGKIRALAVTSAKRNPLIPAVPTLAEAGVPDFTMTAWYGIHLPGRTPPEVVERLNREIAAFTNSPALRKQFADQGLDLVSNAPADYARFIEAEDKKWGAIIKQANITID
jgi:tripartite-type tricarboxylate transporter receptor subunit TctC